MSDDLSERIAALLQGITPGPWELDTSGFDDRAWVQVSNNVAVIHDTPSLGRPTDEEIANAALIAAAPGLLAECVEDRQQLLAQLDENEAWRASTTGQRWLKERAENARLHAKVSALADQPEGNSE